MQTKLKSSMAVILLVPGLAGCGKKEGQSASPATNAAAAYGSPYGHPSQTEPPPAPAVIPDQSAAALGTLTQAVRRFSAERQRVPANLEEVVRAGYIASIPPAPPGKKFVLNTKRLEVTLE